MIRRILGSIVGLAAALVISAGTARAQAPVMSPASINGNVVTFTWTATPGATAYRLDAGTATNSYTFQLPLGNVTTTQVTAPNGFFFVRVVALTPGDVPSNEITVQVPAPPSAPTNLQVARLGTSVVATWVAGSGGGTPTAYQLRVGLTPTGNDYVFTLGTNSFIAGPAPANTYYFRAVAVNAAGASGESNTVAVTMPPGGACDPPPSVTLRTSTFSTFLSVSWSPVPGVSGYLLNASLNGQQVYTDIPFAANSTGLSQLVPLATYDISVRAVFPCGTQSAPTFTRVIVDGAPPPGPRAANPAPGTRLPEPTYGQGVVQSVANARPDLLRNSCVDTGGNNRFLFEVTKALRAIDNRWGNNIKRGFQGLSQDIMTYNNSSNPDEGATTGPTAATLDIYMYDIIGGHCGPNPTTNFAAVHQATINGNARGVWTLQYYLAAGYTP